MKKKYIAIVSKTDKTGGGASRIASGLTDLLNTTEEFEAHHWVGLPGSNKNWYTEKLHGGRWLSLVQGAFAIGSRAIGFPDFLTPELFFHLANKKVNYSLYHFHDISLTFSPIALSWLSKHKPVVWTMHDCSPFTGGCIAPLDCIEFHSGCKSCPQLKQLPLGTKFDFTGIMQAYKAKMLSRQIISLISPSQWLIEESKAAHAFKIKPIYIPNYVNSEIFKPIDKSLVRRVLGLPEDRFIVLLSATGLADKHKGVDFAIEALEPFKNKIFVIGVGIIEKNIQERLKDFPCLLTGYIYNDLLLAQYYASSDLYVFPTLADSFGLVAIETMACGTPSIAFKTGGVPEIIEHNINGWLVKQKDIKGLVEGIQLVMREPERLARWSSNGLKKIMHEYSAEKFLSSHLKLYNSVIK